MRIYSIATTATTAASGDVLMIDKGSGSSAAQITYANFMANPTQVGNSSTTGTYGSLSATSATIGSLSTTLARDYANAYASATGNVTPGASASAASAIGGTWTSATATSDFTVSTAGLLTHVGSDSSLYFVTVSMSITKDATGATATFQLYKTGTAVSHIQTTRAFSGSDTGAMTMSGLVTLGENDTLQVKVYASGGTYTTNVGTSITVVEMT